mgnify:FL=1
MERSTIHFDYTIIIIIIANHYTNPSIINPEMIYYGYAPYWSFIFISSITSPQEYE